MQTSRQPLRVGSIYITIMAEPFGERYILRMEKDPELNTLCVTSASGLSTRQIMEQVHELSQLLSAGQLVTLRDSSRTGCGSFIVPSGVGMTEFILSSSQPVPSEMPLATASPTLIERMRFYLPHWLGGLSRLLG